MCDFDDEKWQRIKLFASRLQAIKSILEIFVAQIEQKPFAKEFHPIKEQLEAEFEKTLTALLEIIDENGDS